MVDVALISHALGVDATTGPNGRPLWWCHAVTLEQFDAAASLGLGVARRLHQMRVPLPLDTAADLPVRPYRPRLDDAAWLAVNNRAFAWHPDQGGWDEARLAEATAEAWFEPEGFLLHEIDGEVAGFCWTKHHPDHEPPAGEIFVIGVDPRFHGRGLGRALTIAGLDWQWRHHRPPLGMLYVEHDNAPAISLYESLGFTVHHDDVAFGLNDGS